MELSWEGSGFPTLDLQPKGLALGNKGSGVYRDEAHAVRSIALRPEGSPAHPCPPRGASPLGQEKWDSELTGGCAQCYSVPSVGPKLLGTQGGP